MSGFQLEWRATKRDAANDEDVPLLPKDAAKKRGKIKISEAKVLAKVFEKEIEVTPTSLIKDEEGGRYLVPTLTTARDHRAIFKRVIVLTPVSKSVFQFSLV